ncbi:helix-turn-helix domain-containing protein [Lutispora sp.]|uniref:helix-turn-helix domain-containing protein n=1 Tax=Lutispora sp. TaxID=2828727 RepID=UPI003562D1D3
MTFNNIHLDGMEAEIKCINNIITSTLRGNGKLVLISGDENKKSGISKFAQDILKLKTEIFSCIIKGYELSSYNSVLKHIIDEIDNRYPNLYNTILNTPYLNRIIKNDSCSITISHVIDILELISKEYSIVILIDNFNSTESNSINLIRDISFFIPYNRFSIICTLLNKKSDKIIEQLDLKDLVLHIDLPSHESHEISERGHLAHLLDKSGYPCKDTNLIVKLFFRSNIQLMNNNISQIHGLLHYLYDNDSFNYYEAMAYYIILLLSNGKRYDALVLTKQISGKLAKKIRECMDSEVDRYKTLYFFILGNYYCYVNKGITAVNILKKGLSLLDEFFFCEYQNSLGCAYMTLGDWTNAEKCFLEAYDSSTNEGTLLPHLYVNLIQLYNLKCEYNRASYYYNMLKAANIKWKNDFVETFLEALFTPITIAIGNNNSDSVPYEKIMNKLLNISYKSLTPLYHFSYLRLYIIVGDHLFRCKDYARAMELYEKALINYDNSINKPYMKNFINIRIMACRSMIGLKPGKFIVNLKLDYKINCPFEKYMLCSLFFFAHIVYLSSNQTALARKYLIRCIRYAQSSNNLIYKGMGYYKLFKLYSQLNHKKAKLYQRKYLETASAMGISPDNIPYTYDSDYNQLEDDRINSIISYIKGNYRKDLTLSMLSKEIHISETHICHLIKDKTGYTFKELLQHTRIQEARKMLTGTLLNVSDIAIAVGFSSSKYFCRVFKEMCGLTPISYRKNHHNHNIKEYV